MGVPLGKLVPTRSANMSGCPTVSWTVHTFDLFSRARRTFFDRFEVRVFPFPGGR